MELIEHGENHYGKTSEARLIAYKHGDKTIVGDSFFTAPFKIMSPFYQEDLMQVMILSASAGIMAGDKQKFLFEVRKGAKAEILSQSYEKIHKMESGQATRETCLKVDSNSYLKYSPLPTLPFAESAFESTTTVYLEDVTSRFVMVEILACGRDARGERFRYRYYKNLVKVYIRDDLIYRDNTRYDPLQFPMEGIGFYEGYSHQANILLFNMKCTPEWIEQVRDNFTKLEDFTGGITRLTSGDVVIRMLGKSAQQLEMISEKLYQYLVKSI